MTSTTGSADTTQHPDVSEISDLTEGLLPPARTAAVRRHLDGCALCADVRTSLDEIRGLLGTLPGPTRMPADIAGRIDAALAAEALLSATAPDTAAHVSRETPAATADSTPAAEASSTPSTTADRPAGRPRATTGPGRPSGRRRRRVAVLGGVLGAAVLGLGTLLLQSGGLQNAADSGDKKVDAASSAADSRFSGAGIDQRVQELLGRDGARNVPKGTTPESMNTESEGNTPMRSADAALPGCVRAGIDRPDPVLAFQPGDYQGTRAYLVVLPHATDSSQVQAYVLDASCAEGGGAAKADVLLTHAYPRT
ncbi:zf-HC2 domain-containing protein [Streptomyces sp. NPDC048604]|uniref:zf-HC2 domain-containing protein n=1 Tax=Streptomyces sp. NPDC048604 TaxID=3365578 RepID=UPI00371E9007